MKDFNWETKMVASFVKMIHSDSGDKVPCSGHQTSKKVSLIPTGQDAGFVLSQSGVDEHKIPTAARNST
jgi:hypothetical protein